MILSCIYAAETDVKTTATRPTQTGGAEPQRSTAFTPLHRSNVVADPTLPAPPTLKRHKCRAPNSSRRSRIFPGARSSRPQRLRTCDDTGKSNRHGARVAAAAGTAALLWLRRRHPVFIVSLGARLRLDCVDTARFELSPRHRLARARRRRRAARCGCRQNRRC